MRICCGPGHLPGGIRRVGAPGLQRNEGKCGFVVGPVTDRAGFAGWGHPAYIFWIVRILDSWLPVPRNGTQGIRRPLAQTAPPTRTSLGWARPVFPDVLRGRPLSGVGMCRGAWPGAAIRFRQSEPLWGMGGRLCTHAGPRPPDCFHGACRRRFGRVGQSLQVHGRPSGIQMAIRVFRPRVAQRRKHMGEMGIYPDESRPSRFGGKARELAIFRFFRPQNRPEYVGPVPRPGGIYGTGTAPGGGTRPTWGGIGYHSENIMIFHVIFLLNAVQGGVCSRTYK